MNCHLNEKEALAFTLSYDTLVELVASASQAEGYLHGMNGWPNAQDISARLRAALDAVTK